MNVFENIRVTIFLIVMIIAAIFALNHSFYGLIVHIQNPSIFETKLIDLDSEILQKNRYLNIKEASSNVAPLVYVNENKKSVKFIYALTPILDSSQIQTSLVKSKILLETKNEITDWASVNIEGLLKPYWSKIDEDLKINFAYHGLQIDEHTEYLKMDSKPWKWYWHVLIILLVLLFFYRMFEALFKK